MILSFQQVAELARVNKSTLFRAIKRGKVSARLDAHGQYRLDPAEVTQCLPVAAGDAEQQRATPRNRDRTDELAAQLREQLRTCASTAAPRTDAETWRNAFETEHAPNG